MIKLFKGLPLFAAKIVDLEDGIIDVSLVDDPAVEKPFLYFGKGKVNFSIQNEEQKLVSGVVMIPDTPIYRRSPELGEYYVTFSKEVIKKMVERMSQENRFNSVTLNHDGNLVEGVTLVEVFLKDTERGINPTYADVPDGTLFATYKVDNPEVWEEIKKGTFRGFSLAGVFDLEEQKSDLDEVLDLLAQVKVRYKL